MQIVMQIPFRHGMGRRAGLAAVAALALLSSSVALAQETDGEELRDAVQAYVKGDYEQALPTLRDRSELGDPQAQYLLALLYLNGDGVKRNESAAAFWLHKAVLQDHAPALYQLGVMLDEGLGINADQSVGRRLLERAAARDDAPAARRLRIMQSPAESDQAELKKAEDLLGLDDQSSAFLYLLRVARRGSADAQYLTGVAYLAGEGTSRNPDKALEWLRRAGDAGHRAAQARLGELLERGEEVRHDLRQALDWYRKAADQGDQDAAEAARALSKRLQQ